MLTNFGKFCRKLRIDNGELLYDMAQRLHVSSAFLSKVENGRSKPPEEWKNAIASLYELSEEQLKELNNLIDESRFNSTIDIRTLRPDDKDMMFAFARKLNSMDKADKDKWKRMLDM